MKKIIVFGLCFGIFVLMDELKEKFYGQPLPGAEPILFAPEVLTAELGAHGRLSFSPDCREVFWSSGEKIYYSTFNGKSLSLAKVAPFVDSTRHDGPVFSRDGRTVYFTSMRRLPEEKDKPNGRLWAVDRSASFPTEKVRTDGRPGVLARRKVPFLHPVLRPRFRQRPSLLLLDRREGLG